MNAELFDELAEQGFDVMPGDLGENVTTRGVDLVALPACTLLRLGPEAVVDHRPRHPCVQINSFGPACSGRRSTGDDGGGSIRKGSIVARRDGPGRSRGHSLSCRTHT